MSRCIWIVRHGERLDNIDKEWRKRNPPRGAWDDTPLSSRGVQQAHEVGVMLAKEKQTIHHVFSSPFLRCLQTTNLILNVIQSFKNSTEENNNEKITTDTEKRTKTEKINVEPGFCESLHVCQRPPGYNTMDEIKKTFRRVNENYRPFLRREQLRTETTSICCFERVKDTLEHVLNNCEGNILIISHGSPISACHALLTRQFCYVGQCTVSKYVAVNTDNNNDENGNNKLASQGDSLHNFKCLYVGDSHHLSDARELRDVLRLNEAEKQMLQNYVTCSEL